MAITLTITDLESLSAKQRKTVTQFIESVASEDTCSGSGKCHDHGNAVDAPENWGQSRTAIINKAHGFNAEELAESVKPVAAPTAAMAAFGPKPNATSTVAAEAQVIAPEVAQVTTTIPAIPAPVQQNDSEEAAQTESATPLSLVNGVEVDSTGLPWDVRIHASNKSRAKAGAWIRKRNVDDVTFIRIEAQLRHALNAPVLPPVIPASPLPPVVSVPMATLQPLVQQIPAIPLPPVIPELPLVDVPAFPPAAPVTMSFLQLVTAVTPMVQSGKLTQAELNEVLASVGISELRLLATRPDLVPQVENILRISGKL